MINFNKIKKDYHKLRWKYHHEFKRKSYILRKKYFVQEYTIKIFLISLLELIFLICLIVIFLKFIGVIRYENDKWIFILIIWIITVINGGNGSIMMLLVSIGYLLINIYGAKKNKKIN